MKIKYLGHSGFLIDDLLIDPFLVDGPFKIDKDSIECNIICITHDHVDHISGAFETAKKNNATIVAIFEIAQDAENKGIKAEGMNIGGEVEIGDWRIKMVEAKHSSEKGTPVGFVLRNLKEDKVIYHAGDTGLFGDMELIGQAGIDIAMLPIGGRYTMNIDDALKAVKLLKAKKAIPMHYNTFPVINADPFEFKKLCPVPVEVFKLEEEKSL